MPEFGHQIDWLMQRGPESQNLEETDWLGNRVYLTPRSNRSGFMGRVLNNLYAMFGDFRVFSLAKRNRYDILQVRDKYFASILTILAARMTGARFMYWMSYPFSEHKMYLARNKQTRYPRLLLIKGFLMKIVLYRFILPQAAHIFVQSEQMKKDVAAEGIPVEKMTPVPMGIRADQVGSANDAKKLDTESPVLLYLGIILRIRQSHMLVDVLERVRRKYPQARLIYVGEGQNIEDRQAVEQAVKDKGLDDAVTITGFLPMTEAWEYVKKADICFSPFYPIPVLLSTSPTKLVEYLAMAKCVVANEHPEQCQILQDSGVGECIPWDEQSFADKIVDILDNPERSEQRASLGPEWVRKHRTYDVISAQVNDIYRQLTKD
jgi:glycosyltransferase involved in cell wall biosynthesis